MSRSPVNPVRRGVAVRLKVINFDLKLVRSSEDRTGMSEVPSCYPRWVMVYTSRGRTSSLW